MCHILHIFLSFFPQLNTFSTMSDASYDRPTTQSEQALYNLVQEHLKAYDAVKADPHGTSIRFKALEKTILENWSEKVRSSIFGDSEVEL